MEQKYLETISRSLKTYFEVLEPIFPYWLVDYIETKELLKQKYISTSCGTIYSDLFESNYFYSSLDHSVAVALICWHFTKNKKITLAGLFHDIATPVFKHCVDFLNGDYMSQESTEELTKQIIEKSPQIMKLLKRDNIDISKVCDYHIYSIADNNTPNLSSDRLEYSLSNALFTYKLIDIEKVKEIYNDISILKDENGIDELSFNTESLALKFVELTSKLSIIYREDRTRYSMQFIADILKKLSEQELISKKDLYELKESEIIDIINKSQYKDTFNKWRKAKKVMTSNKKPSNLYYVHIKAKVRYIDPLVLNNRISKLNKIAYKLINNNLKYDMDKYVYLDFTFQ